MTPRNSVFLTVMGSIFALGFASLALQFGLLSYALSTEGGKALLVDMQTEFQKPGGLRDVHPLLAALVTHTRLVALVLFNLSVLGVVVSVALVRRLRWARGAAIGLLVLAMACLTGDLVWRASHLTPAMPPEERAAWILFPLVAAVLLGWMVVQLQKPRIRAEFESEGAISALSPPTAG